MKAFEANGRFSCKLLFLAACSYAPHNCQLSEIMQVFCDKGDLQYLFHQCIVTAEIGDAVLGPAKFFIHIRTRCHKTENAATVNWRAVISDVILCSRGSWPKLSWPSFLCFCFRYVVCSSYKVDSWWFGECDIDLSNTWMFVIASSCGRMGAVWLFITCHHSALHMRFFSLYTWRTAPVT